MSEWRTARIRDVAEVFDGPHATPTKTQEGPWYLSISSLDRGSVDLSASAHISEDDFMQWTRRVRAEPGDTLFSYETRLGSAGHWSLDVPAALGRRMGILRPKLDVIDPRFLTYAYLGPEFQEQIRRRANFGATVDRIPIADLPSWAISIPPLEEQRRIAGVLGALDDLASVEVDIASSSGKLWRALVTRSIARGSPMQVPLSSMACFVNGRNFTKNALGTGRPVIRTPEVRNGPNPNTVLNDIDVAADHIAQIGDILFVWSGSLCVNRWAFGEGLVNQHVFKVLPNEGVPDWLVFYAVERQMQWFLSLAADKATTMGHIQRRHLDAAVRIPSDLEIEQLEPLVRPLWDQELASRIDARAATGTRDELLPLLLSGRVRVREVAA